jgi:hypothetical protein
MSIAHLVPGTVAISPSGTNHLNGMLIDAESIPARKKGQADALAALDG